MIKTARPPAPHTDFDVVVIARAMKDHNNDCGIDENSGCPHCFEAASHLVAEFRAKGRLSPPLGSFITCQWPERSSSPWHFDLGDDDPNVILVNKTMEGEGHGWSDKDRLELSKVAVSALYRNKRLQVPEPT